MAALDQEKVDKIKQYLRWHPRGMTISDLSSKIKMNRNMVAKYLDLLLISGQVEMETIGAAKVYFLSHRVPISAMLEFSSDYVIVLDTGQIVIQVNEPVLKFLNEKREALIGKKISEITNPFFSCLPTPEPVKNGQIAEEKVTEISSLLNGERHHFRVKMVPTAFEDGGQGLTYLIEDITAKKTSEESLQMSEVRYRGIVEDQTEFITRFRPDGTLTFVNESYARYLGKKPADLLGRYHIPGINEDDCVALNQTLLSLDRENPAVITECRVSDQYGQVCWNLWTIRALFDDKGIVHEYQGVGRDNTEKREAAARINNYIQSMEFLSKTGTDFMDMREDDDIYEYIAQQVYSLAPGFLVWVGYLDEPNQKLILKSVIGNPIALDTMHQLTGTRVGDMTFPINKADTAELIQHRRLVKTPALFRLLHMQVPEERCRQVEEAAGGIESYLMGLVSKGRILGDVGISLQSGSKLPNRDLIEAFIRQAAIAIDRKIAEDALKKSEQRYRSVIDNIQDVFYRTDQDGNLIMASPSWAQILGYESLNECLGRNIAETFYMEPVKRKEFLEAVYRDGEVRDYEVVLKRKDSSPLYVAVSSHMYHDESGAVLGVEGIFRDVSERHAAAEKIRSYIAQMEFLSRKLQEFIELPPASDIYSKIASDLKSLVPDAMILVNSFDSATENLTLRSLLSDADLAKCTQHLGRCPLGLNLRVDFAAIEGLRNGRLHKMPLSLFEMCFKQIPEDICKKITASVNMGDFYSIGFVQGDENYGNATIFLYKGSTIQNLPLIETYAFQASIALQKRVAEEALKESERKRAEEALKNSENYLLKIFNSTQSGLVVIDPETYTIFDANSTAAELIGMEKSSIVGSCCKKWFCPAENEPCPVMDLRQQLVRSEGVLNNVKGETRSVIKTVVPVQLGGREYLLESFVDITERKKAEEALRESEKRFRDLAGMLPQCVWECDAEGTLTFVNNRGLEMYRYESEDLDKGLTIWQTIYPDDLERVRQDVIQDFEDFYRGTHKFPGFVHYTALRKDRSTFPCDTYATLMVRDNQIVGMRGMGIDLTERNNAEEALRESEERFHDLTEMLPQNVWECDAQGNLTFVNRRSLEMYRYSPEDLDTGLTIWQMIHPDDRERVHNDFIEGLKHEPKKFPECHEFTALRKDGSTFPLLVYHVPIVHDNKITGMRGIGIDITDRKLAEEALRESEARMFTILHSSPIPKYVIDSDYRVVYWNKELEELSGIKAQEVIGTTRRWQAISDPELPCLADLMIDGNRELVQEWYKEKITPSRFMDGAVEVTVFYPDASKGGRWLLRTAVAIKDGKGTTLGAVETIEDITDRHHLEK